MTNEEKTIIEFIIIAILIYLSYCVYKASVELELEKRKSKNQRKNNRIDL